MSTENENKDLLSKEEVYDVLRFAQELYAGVYSPYLVNNRLKDITLSPQAATSEKINTALASPKDNEQQLIGYVQWMELQSMLFKRILLYFSGLLSFDWNYVCINVKDPKEYGDTKYKRDLYEVQSFFDRFDVKKEFRTAIKQMMRSETFYSVFRDDGVKYVLQELPQDRCKLTGRFEQGLLFDFDMLWFVQPGTSLEMYPPIFTKMYRRIWGDKAPNKPYDPASPLGMRTGVFAQWEQTSPEDGFYAFKLFPEIGSNVPMLSPLLGTTVLEPVIRELQQNSYIQQASKLIFGQVPLLKDAGTKLADNIAMKPETAARFLSLLQSSLPSAIKVAAAPLENTSALEFNGSDTIYDSYLTTTAASSGVNSRLIYAKDRQNILETKLSLDIDQNVLRPVYSQFENFLEYFVNKRTKYYKFKFLMEGFETSVNRDERLSTASKLAESGIVLEQKFASAIGLSPFDFRRMLEETRVSGFVKNLTPIVKASQMPANGSTGRPTKKDEDLTDSGSETREAGSNIDKG